MITLSEAARRPGAPAQPALHRMTGSRSVPGFLVKTGEGWRIDTDNAEWGAYLARAAARQAPQIASGNRVKEAKGQIKRTKAAKIPAMAAGQTGDEEEPEEGNAEKASVQKAVNAKIVYNARREKLKMEQDEIKTGAMKEEYVVKAEGEFWLSFIQREMTDAFGVVRRCMGEVKRLIMAGEDIQAGKYLAGELRTAFERTARKLEDTLEGKEEEQ